jgi:hypothetical protein
MSGQWRALPRHCGRSHSSGTCFEQHGLCGPGDGSRGGSGSRARMGRCPLNDDRAVDPAPRALHQHSHAGECVLTTVDNLAEALRAFDACGLERLPVIDMHHRARILGIIEPVEVRTLNTAGSEATGEEGGGRRRLLVPPE